MRQFALAVVNTMTVLLQLVILIREFMEKGVALSQTIVILLLCVSLAIPSWIKEKPTLENKE